MHVRVCLLGLLLAILPLPAIAAESELFPFLVSYENPENATNVAAWLPKPAGKQGFVRAEGGHFVVGNGTPIRFWATNMCFEGCFPTHAEADRLAARLARLGINCVRMHHMDNRSIWGDSPNKTIIDPKKLERLDYLIFQLKQHGIYTNLNLHVSRWFDKAEGFSDRELRPNYDKGLDNFEPRMIELQKKYAHDLLAHVNPYTKTAYTDEPAVAMVEINNENALWATWGWGHLDNLPEPYAGTFRKLWNARLAKKYGTTEKLRKAWNAQSMPLGKELLRNGDFSKPLDKIWNTERDAQTGVEFAIQPQTSGSGKMLRIVVTRQGEVAWHPQLSQSGLTVKKGMPYTLTLRARANDKRSLSLNCMMAHDPWQRLGLDGKVDIGPQWQQHRLTFIAEQDDDKARITISGLTPGTYELADVSLRPGGITGLEPNERLEDATVPVLKAKARGLTEAARADWADFLYDTEADYWLGMYRFLKQELGVKPVVSGTQIGYSPSHLQSQLDYIDAHSYWEHPHFPNRPWDRNDWYVNDVALVNSPGGTLTKLAATRVFGKPFTVSEYNHPHPIRYAAEGFPMIAAFGAFQGWDGIFSFAYSHNSEFEVNQIQSFFDIKADPAKLVHMPACAAMFLRGDVSPSPRQAAAWAPREQERAKLRETLSAWNIRADEFGIDARLGLTFGIGLELGPQRPAQEAPKLGEKVPSFVSNQMRWDLSQAGAGYFTVDAPRTKLFTGFVRGRQFPIGNVELSIGKTRLDWTTISMTAVEGDRIGQPGRLLIAATGLVQNTGTQLEDLGKNRVTLRSRWGSAPVLCEGIPAEISLPVAADRVRLYPLDNAGNRRSAIQVESRSGKAVVKLGPEHKTLWYEVEVR